MVGNIEFSVCPNQAPRALHKGANGTVHKCTHKCIHLCAKLCAFLPAPRRSSGTGNSTQGPATPRRERNSMQGTATPRRERQLHLVTGDFARGSGVYMQWRQLSGILANPPPPLPLEKGRGVE